MPHALKSLFLALVTAGTVSLAPQVEAQSAQCAALERDVMEARASGDLARVQTSVKALGGAVGVCSARETEAIRRLAALAYFDRAIAKATPETDRETLLREGLKLERPWKMSATLADLEYVHGNFATATSLYQDALDDMRDEAANPVRPSDTVFKKIIKRAEEAALLAPVYVSRMDKKRGGPGGLASTDWRGFTVKKMSVPIQFKYNETVFTDDGEKAAKDMLSYLSQQGVTSITLIGHTDHTGARDYNLKLSADRAKAVASFLKINGFTGTVSTTGKGFDAPFEDDGSLALSKEQRDQINRRVELER